MAERTETRRVRCPDCFEKGCGWCAGNNYMIRGSKARGDRGCVCPPYGRRLIVCEYSKTVEPECPLCNGIEYVMREVRYQSTDMEAAP